MQITPCPISRLSPVAVSGSSGATPSKIVSLEALAGTLYCFTMSFARYAIFRYIRCIFGFRAMSEFVPQQKMSVLIPGRRISNAACPALTGLLENLAALCLILQSPRQQPYQDDFCRNHFPPLGFDKMGIV